MERQVACKMVIDNHVRVIASALALVVTGALTAISLLLLYRESYDVGPNIINTVVETVAMLILYLFGWWLATSGNETNPFLSGCYGWIGSHGIWSSVIIPALAWGVSLVFLALRNTVEYLDGYGADTILTALILPSVFTALVFWAPPLQMAHWSASDKLLGTIVLSLIRAVLVILFLGLAGWLYYFYLTAG